MNHKAIYALYPNAVTIDDTEGVFDASGNKIEIDLDAVNSWVNPNQYAIDRQKAYPSFADQFDLLYHGGYDAWKAAIDEVKTNYPKPI